MDATQLALLAGICAEPLDDTPRLIYADWLEEHAGTIPCHNCRGSGWEPGREEHERCSECMGEQPRSDGRKERAEFIRLQIRLPAMRSADAAGTTAVEDRCRYLLETYRSQWFANAPCKLDAWSINEPILPYHFGIRCLCTRGFPSQIVLSFELFKKHESALIWHPAQTSTCPHCEGRGEVRVTDAAGDMDDEPCIRCGGSLAGGGKKGLGRVSRECPETAQPITRVTLTSGPGIDVFRQKPRTFSNDFYAHERDESGWIYRNKQFPGIDFCTKLDWANADAHLTAEEGRA